MTEEAASALEPGSPFWAPLKAGWVRELVYRASIGQGNTKADAYYKAPKHAGGKKYRSLKEMERAIEEGKPGFEGLSLANFSFRRDPLKVNDPSMELIRGADPSAKIPNKRHSDVAESPPAKKPKKASPMTGVLPKQAPLPTVRPPWPLLPTVAPPRPLLPTVAPPRPLLPKMVPRPALSGHPQTAIRSRLVFPTIVPKPTQAGARPMGFAGGIRPVPANFLKGKVQTAKPTEEIVCEPAIYGIGKFPANDTAPTSLQATNITSPPASTRVYQNPSDSKNVQAMGLMDAAVEVSSSGQTGHSSSTYSGVARSARSTRGTILAIGEAKKRLGLSEQMRDDKPVSPLPEPKKELDVKLPTAYDGEVSTQSTDEGIINHRRKFRRSSRSGAVQKHLRAKRLASKEAEDRLLLTREAEESSGDSNNDELFDKNYKGRIKSWYACDTSSNSSSDTRSSGSSNVHTDSVGSTIRTEDTVLHGGLEKTVCLIAKEERVVFKISAAREIIKEEALCEQRLVSSRERAYKTAGNTVFDEDTPIQSSNRQPLDLTDSQLAFDQVLFELNELVQPLGRELMPWDEQRRLGLDILDYVHNLSIIITNEPLTKENGKLV